MKAKVHRISINNILEDTRKKQLILFLLMFILIFIRFCYYGFEYYHQLDDYIQYHNYAQRNTPLRTIINSGILAARPLAGVMDILVWSQFFSFMIVPVAIISVLFAASAILFHHVWKRHFGTGYVFLILHSLLPLGIEGTYWVSASSRIVLGLFFAAAALYCFDKWCEEGKKRHLIIYALTQAVCYGFYEQMLVLSLTMTVLVAIIYYKRHKSRALWGLLSFFSVALYFYFTSLVKNSSLYSSRLKIVIPFGHSYFKLVFPNVLNQVLDAFGKGAFYTLVKGAWRGFGILLEDKNIAYVLTVILLCFVYYYIAKKDTVNSNTIDRVWPSVIFGFLMALAPVTVFFIIDNAWFSLRGTVASFCGLALLIDTLMRYAFDKFLAGRKILIILSSVFIFICCVASVSEIHDYRATNEADRRIVTLLANKLEEDGNLRRDLNIAVLNIEPTYLSNQNFQHHEHIHGVTESVWAFTGALESQVGYYNTPRVAPMPIGIMYRPWNCEVSRLDNFDFIYFYISDEIINVQVNSISDYEFELFIFDGEYIGKVFEENMYGYLFLG